MKLKLAEYYSDKYPKGHIFEIDDIMRSADCASGVKVRVHMGKSPTWLDLSWFVPQNKTRSNKAFTRRGGTVAKKDKVAKPPRG